MDLSKSAAREGNFGEESKGFMVWPVNNPIKIVLHPVLLS
jgi:hypothetical protein